MSITNRKIQKRITKKAYEEHKKERGQNGIQGGNGTRNRTDMRF